jgi:hypothetical protein
MPISIFEEEKDFIANLQVNSGKPLKDWFATIADSSHTQFLDIRQWLVDEKKLDTPTATTIARLYLEEQEISAPKLFFHTAGRGGDYSYQSKEGSFSSWWEFGGNDVIAILNIPSAEHWEAQTHIPLSKRAAILDFIGEKTVEKQIGSGRGHYEVQENFILIRNK